MHIPLPPDAFASGGRGEKSMIVNVWFVGLVVLEVLAHASPLGHRCPTLAHPT